MSISMVDSNSYEKEDTFKYLDSLLTNQNSIQKEIKCRLTKFMLLFTVNSWLLSKNLKMEIYKTIILYGPRGKESTEVQKSQIKGKESENSYQKLKRSQNDRNTQTSNM